MKRNMKSSLVFLFTALILASNIVPSFAKAKNEALADKITPKTVIAGALSLLVWPGIGQAINENKGEKILTHAALGLLPPYRFWSCYDAVVDRKDGYWHGRI
ncbi:MAG: hypothetical protein WCG23_07200 [bacterium]